MFKYFDKKDLNNTKWFLSEELFQVVIGIIIIPKIFVSLGAPSMGDLNFVKTVIYILTPIFSLSLNDIAIREIIFSPNKSNKIIGTSIVLQLLSWLTLFSIIFTYFTFFDKDKLYSLYLIVSMSFLFKIGIIPEMYFLAKKKSKIIFFSRVSSLLVAFAFQLYGINNNYGVEYFAVLISVEFLLQGVFYFYILRKEIQLDLLKFSRSTAKKLLVDSSPLLLTNLFIFLYLSLDQIFIKYFHNNEAVAYFFSVQYLVIGLTWRVGFALINALYPSIADSFKNNKDLYFKKMSILLKIVTIYGAAIFIFYNLFGDFILREYFDGIEKESGLALKIFSFAPLVIFIGMIYEKHIINNNETLNNVYRFGLGIIVHAILLYILVPEYKITGVAISLLTSHFVVNIIYILIDKKNRVQLKQIL